MADRDPESPEALLASAPDLIFHLDLDGTIRYANRALPAGLDWPGPSGSACRAAALHVAATGTPVTIEASAAATWYSCHLGPIHRAGRVVGVVVVARDITEQKEHEHQLIVADRMASLGTLAAGIAHEINNPLAAVIANLELALRRLGGVAPVEVLEQLRDAGIAAGRVQGIVRDLKLFSRPEDEPRAAIDVQEVVESTLRMAGNEIRHRARLVRDFAPVPPVLASEARLGQVVLDLLVNAIQAIPEGDADHHELRAATWTDDAGRAVIAISDTGAGIPPEIRARIFTPFFTTRPIGTGTGLGLPICHRIVTALGGELELTSEVGRGTEFRVVLPPAPAAAAAAAPQTAPPLPAGRPAAPRRGRVLVVDDEPIILRTIRRVLAGEHEVVTVDGAAAALARLDTGEQFDAILCDLMMPQMSGMELHAELARRTPDLAARMVFMTGGAFTERSRAFLTSVANPRLDKPFDAGVLRRVVGELVR